MTPETAQAVSLIPLSRASGDWTFEETAGESPEELLEQLPEIS